MKRLAHHRIARAIGIAVVVIGVSACQDNANDPAPLQSGDAAACKSACMAHSTCTTECESACAGRCVGSMSTNDFPDVDSVDCAQSGVTFHKGGSELTCYP